MTEQDAFLAAIRESPEDDAPRLMYADWLTEQGDPRGEFIRVQCELAGMDSEDPRHPALIHQVNSLLRKYSRHWRATLPRLRGLRWGNFERGFVSGVTASSVGALLACLDQALATTPLATIRLRTDYCQDLGKLFARPCAARIVSLEIAPSSTWNRPGEDCVRFLAAAPHASGLRSLRLAGINLRSGGIAALTASPYLEKLRRLALEDVELGDAIATSLAESAGFPSLTSLSLVGTRLGPDSVIALANSNHLRLTELDLSENDITVPGLQSLAASPKMAGLTHLGLASYRGAAAGIEALLLSRHLLGLQYLDLTHHRIATLRPEVLATAPHDTALRQLLFPFGTLGKDGAQALAGCPRLAGLRELVLDHNPLGDEGISALARSPFLRGLRRLSLRGTGISSKGAKALAAGEWRQLGVVDLRNNRIWENGVRALLAAPIGKHASVLDLRRNPFRATGAELLSQRRVRAWPSLPDCEE